MMPGKEEEEEPRSMKEVFVGKDRNEDEKGERLVGGSDHGEELADEIIDDFDIPLDPDEQEMVHEELEKAKMAKKRRKVRSIVKEKLKKRKQPEVDGSGLTGISKDAVDDDDLSAYSKELI